MSINWIKITDRLVTAINSFLYEITVYFGFSLVGPEMALKLLIPYPTIPLVRFYSMYIVK